MSTTAPRIRVYHCSPPPPTTLPVVLCVRREEQSPRSRTRRADAHHSSTSSLTAAYRGDRADGPPRRDPSLPHNGGPARPSASRSASLPHPSFPPMSSGAPSAKALSSYYSQATTPASSLDAPPPPPSQAVSPASSLTSSSSLSSLSAGFILSPSHAASSLPSTPSSLHSSDSSPAASFGPLHPHPHEQTLSPLVLANPAASSAVSPLLSSDPSTLSLDPSHALPSGSSSAAPSPTSSTSTTVTSAAPAAFSDLLPHPPIHTTSSTSVSSDSLHHPLPPHPSSALFASAGGVEEKASRDARRRMAKAELPNISIPPPFGPPLSSLLGNSASPMSSGPAAAQRHKTAPHLSNHRPPSHPHPRGPPPARRRSSASHVGGVGGVGGGVSESLRVDELTRWDGWVCLVLTFYLLLYLALHFVVGSSFWALTLPLMAWGGWEFRGWRGRGAGAGQPGADGDDMQRREREEEEREAQRREAIEREKETLRHLMAQVLKKTHKRQKSAPVEGAGEEGMEGEEERKGEARLAMEITTPHNHSHVVVGKVEGGKVMKGSGLDVLRTRGSEADGRALKALGSQEAPASVGGG